MNDRMNELYIYIAFSSHPKHFTVEWGGDLTNHHQCVAPTWMMLGRTPPERSPHTGPGIVHDRSESDGEL